MRGKLVTLKTTINIREERQKSVCTVHIAYSFDVEDIVQWRRGVNRVFCRSQIHLQFILHSCILLSNGNVWEHHCHISLLLWLAKSERRQTIRRIFPQEVLERNKIASNCSESPYFQMMLAIQLLHINTFERQVLETAWSDKYIHASSFLLPGLRACYNKFEYLYFSSFVLCFLLK